MSEFTVIVPSLGRSMLSDAIRSALSQTLAPLEIIVVSDAPINADKLDANARIRHLVNERAKGLSGAVNTALAHARGEWIALLDDDDTWEPDHLARSAAVASSSDVIYTGIVRHTSDGVAREPVPAAVTIEDFLRGNPGIQSSNLVVRRLALLRAGGFDEALESTTDRDVMIRLLELPGLQVTGVNAYTVHHYALDHPRLSTPGSPKKVGGLRRFYAKHRHRMSPEVDASFRARARNLFHCELSPDDIQPCAVAAPTPARGKCELRLILASSFSSSDSIRRWVRGAIALHDTGLPVRLVVAVGASVEVDRALEAAARALQDAGIQTRVLASGDAEQRAIAGRYGDMFLDPRSRSGVAYGRTILHHEVYSSWEDGDAAWILDDDLDLMDTRLEDMVVDGAQLAHHIQTIAARADVAVGGIHGDPPIPSLATVRTSLVDVLHVHQGGAMIPLDGPDVYYDLSETRYDHLETGQGITGPAEATISAIGLGLSSRKATPRTPYGNPPARGGNTLVFHPDVLHDYPNISPIVHGSPTRRGDTLWLLRLQFEGPRRAGIRDWRIHATPLSVHQGRSPSSLHLSTLLADIRGAALVRAVRAVGRLPKNRHELRRLIGCYREALGRRLRAALLNAHRVHGLCDILGRAYPMCEATLSSLWTSLSPASLAAELDRIDDAARDVEHFLHHIGAYSKSYRKGLPRRHGITGWREARRVLSDIGEADAALVAHGEEGAVFAAGQRAFKVFHVRRKLHNPSTLATLHRISGRPRSCFVPTLRIRDHDDALVIEMPLLEGQSYRGGHVRDLLRILKEARELELVHTNVSPENLVVTSEGVKLVDPGRSLLELTESSIHEMAKRLYLTYRWHFRSDLKETMTQALTDETIPELFGFKSFVQAATPNDPERATLDAVLDMVGEGRARRALDLGCGKGRLAEALAARGWNVDGYDPNPSRYPIVARARYLMTPPIETYDLVLAKQVLCVLTDAEARLFLSDVRARVKEHGEAIITFCSPFDHAVAETEQGRHQTVEYAGTTARERQLTCGTTRRDIHREVDAIRRLVHEAGFTIAERTSTTATELESMCDAEAQTIWRLRPIARNVLRDVTLTIRCSAMEHRTLEWQVRHIVDALTGPAPLAEIVVVTDDRVDGFARPFAEADLDAQRHALQRLVSQGVVDRVVWATPSDATSWFANPPEDGRAANLQPLHVMGAAFSAARTRYLLHVDSDIVIARDHEEDLIGRLRDVLASDDHAITVAPPIARGPASTTARGKGGPWRVEARIGLIDIERLRQLVPMPLEGEAGVRPWHRALDRVIEPRGKSSWRLGFQSSWFAHVPNELKTDPSAWMNFVLSIECGRPRSGAGVEIMRTEMATMLQRHEPFVFLVRWRDLSLAKARRAMTSIRAQAPDAGIILLAAGADLATRDWMREQARENTGMTAWVDHECRPASANIHFALTQLIPHPDTVVIMVDGDDALLPGAFARIEAEYAAGADAVIGGMLRTDKPSNVHIDLANPRARGSAPWTHVRTFRRRLFDAVREQDLKFDGQWMPHTEDWAFMVPILETARSASALQEPTYWYEPHPDKARRSPAEREAIIATIMTRSRP